MVVGGGPGGKRIAHVTSMKYFETICDALSAGGDHIWLWEDTNIVYPADNKPVVLLTEWGKCPFEVNRMESLHQTIPLVDTIILYDQNEKQLRENVAEHAIAQDKSKIDIMVLPFKAGRDLMSSIQDKVDVHIDLNLMIRKDEERRILLSITNAMTTFTHLCTLISITVFCAGIYLARCHSDRYSMEIDRSGFTVYRHETIEGDGNCKPMETLTEEQFAMFPEVEYGSSLKKCNSTTCSICLEDFGKREKVRLLPCGHLFHSQCVSPWLTKRSSHCPLCKENFNKMFVSEGNKAAPKKRFITIIRNLKYVVRRARARDPSSSSVLPR
jgi:hypothetical protein